MTDLYVRSLAWDASAIDGGVYNAGYYNQAVDELAEAVRRRVGEDVEVAVEPTDDNRSYRIDSGKIKRELGFSADRSIDEAVDDLLAAFKRGGLPNAMTDPRYYNIKTMQQVGLR